MLGRTADRLIGRFGWRRGGILAAQLRASKLLRAGSLVRVDVPLFAHPVRLRARSSDRQVLQELLEEPAFDVLDAIRPLFIVDAGANIGLVSALLATRHPAATIVALEIDPANHALLTRNAAPYRQVQPLLAGLWSHMTELFVENPQSAAWAFRATDRAPAGDGPARSGGVRAMTVSSILAEFGVAEIDVLKVDIEGGEREVFGATASAWLPRVRCIVIELHDRLVPGCAAAVASALGDGFVRVHSGQLDVYARRDVADAFRDSPGHERMPRAR